MPVTRDLPGSIACKPLAFRASACSETLYRDILLAVLIRKQSAALPDLAVLSYRSAWRILGVQCDGASLAVSRDEKLQGPKSDHERPLGVVDASRTLIVPKTAN